MGSFKKRARIYWSIAAIAIEFHALVFMILLNWEELCVQQFYTKAVRV